MYVQYKVNVSENQVDILNDAIRLKKAVFQKVSLSAKQVVRNVTYTGGFIDMLASLAACAIPLVARALPTILSGLTNGPLLRFVEGGRLILKHGEDISDGASLLMGKNSPFRNIPALGWLL